MLDLILTLIGVSTAKSVNAAEHHKKNCESYLVGSGTNLTESEKKLSASKEFAEYLNTLLERRVIGTAELKKFEKGLREGKAVNPIEEQEAALNSALYIHYEGLESRLSKSKLDLEWLKTWVGGVLKRTEDEHGARDTVQADSRNAVTKIVFHPVIGAKFERRGNEIELTHEIEVMEYPMTQGQWVEIFHLNPSTFKDGPYKKKLKVGKTEIELQPENPVENITWWSCVVAANKLSEIRGLKPVYDLSGIKWAKGTSAEAGTLEVESGGLKLTGGLKDYYAAEGYRLPTYAEFAYLLHLNDIQNGKVENRYSAAMPPTEPVGGGKSITVGQNRIYDVQGGISHWTYDFSMFGRGFVGKNPVNHGDKSESFHMIVDSLEWGESAFSANRGDIGFRLVRTLK